MNAHSKNKLPPTVNRLCLAFALLFPFAAFGQGSAGGGSGDTRQHLFILSGQSNMTDGLAKGFTAKVEEAFGRNNVTVAMSMKSGRAIRYWCRDYEYPDKRMPTEKERLQNGSLYEPLIKAVKDAAGEKSSDTVTFIWMQGESDAFQGWAESYADGFMKLMDRLRKDLGRNDIRFVVGRLSDYDMGNLKLPHWTRMREVQVHLAESQDGGAWIDTDDLMSGEAAAGGDLHYGKAESVTLGERFAAKAIEMIRAAKAASAPDK